jgi:hypothetical protein
MSSLTPRGTCNPGRITLISKNVSPPVLRTHTLHLHDALTKNLGTFPKPIGKVLSLFKD